MVSQKGTFSNKIFVEVKDGLIQKLENLYYII